MIRDERPELSPGEQVPGHTAELQETGPDRRPAREHPMVPVSLLQEALLGIAGSVGLHWFDAANYATLGIVEGIAHELSHFLDLGASFEDALRAMGDQEANEREASVLRVEVAALATMGVRLAMRRLWATANWREIGRPTLARLRSPLSRSERRRVGRFVSMVTTELSTMQGSGS